MSLNVMTSQELHTLIQSDPQAAAMLATGDDVGCAARCSVIVPKVLRDTRLGRLGILGLYTDPIMGATVLSTMQTIAAGNPVIAYIWDAMAPNVPPENMPDWSLPQIRAALTAPVEAGGLGLTAEQAAPILAAAEYTQMFSHVDIAEARKAGA